MPRKYHALKVPKARQDWSKWNLYNLQRMRDPPAGNKTFFQQKWLAKSYLRAYHNPYVREGQWTRMFDRRLPAVVPMDFRYLARTDGSEEATGRGMGLDQEMDEEALRKPQQLGRYSDRRTAKTPYMQMSFHPLERRLDTAIFRALFASSTKQARQFVVHGSVKVNGKKMIYPGYLLNPGDMFSVDPERVLFATGAPKRQTASAGGKKQNAEEGEGEGEEASEGQEESSEECKEKSSKDESEAPESTAESTPEDVKKTLQSLMKRATTITDSAKNDLSGRRLKDMRDFTKTLRKAMSQAGRRQDDKASLNTSVEDLTKLLEEITAKIPQANLPASEVMKSSKPATASGSQDQEPEKQDNYKAQKDAGLLFRALQRARENPIDPTKPYQTPWRPRDYMSAFAFIPRYLEVNQNICSAVYLRHPVARPGLAEVPTPFGDKTSGLAFNWYLRRR